jgi:hypothetical protein
VKNQRRLLQTWKVSSTKKKPTPTVTNKLAVSGVIKRYDGKVNNHKIDQYNKLVNDLCS